MEEILQQLIGSLSHYLHGIPGGAGFLPSTGLQFKVHLRWLTCGVVVWAAEPPGLSGWSFFAKCLNFVVKHLIQWLEGLFLNKPSRPITSNINSMWSTCLRIRAGGASGRWGASSSSGLVGEASGIGVAGFSTSSSTNSGWGTRVSSNPRSGRTIDDQRKIGISPKKYEQRSLLIPNPPVIEVPGYQRCLDPLKARTSGGVEHVQTPTDSPGVWMFRGYSKLQTRSREKALGWVLGWFFGRCMIILLYL